MTLSSESHIHFQAIITGPMGFSRIEMMLDTGATLVSIPTSIARDLGYDIDQPTATLPIITASGAVHAPVIMLNSVEVLGAVATDVRAACMDMPVGIGFDGLLGLSFLRNFDVDLHFRSGEIRFR